MMKRFTLFLTALLCTVGLAMAQQRTVRGVVITGDDNAPATGANVVVKGHPGLGASADLDGRFEIKNVPAGAKTLIVSYIGYATQEVTIGPNLRIVLETDAKQFDEVVVLGYGSARKAASIASSVVTVKAKDLESKPVANAFDAVQGKVAGLQVFTASGEPSQLSAIKLHGAGSLGAGSDPLYVLDGMPVSAETIRSLNSNDFESFQVLKDAAATSIYGARAANGVIYITTKRGRSGDRASITVRGQYGWSSLANREYYDSMMNSAQLVDFWLTSGLRTQAQVDKLLAAYPHDTRWDRYYFKDNRPTKQADISVSGGAGSTQYYISAATFDQEGLRYGSDYSKNSFRVNLNTSLNKYIRLGTNNSLAVDKYKTNPYTFNSTNGGLSTLALPMYSPYDKDGKEYDYIPGWNRYSPRYLAEKMPAPNSYTTLNSSSFIDIKPVEGLTVRSQIGYELSDYRYTSTRMPSYAGAVGNGTREEWFTRRKTLTSTNTAEYKFTVADKHHFIALAGHEYVRYSSKSFSGKGQGLVNDQLIELGLVTKEKEVSSSTAEYAFLSYFGRLSYDYADKYFIDLTYRNDASSRFGKNNRNGHFWSLGAMWVAKKEGFLADQEWLTDARVKFSVGTQGNAAIGNYGAYALVGSRGQYQSAFGWGVTTPGNPELSWEKQFKSTLGFEVNLWKKLRINFELYHRLTSGMLMDVPYPHHAGFIDDDGRSEITENVGKYQNRGFDLKVEYDFIRDKNDDGLSAYVNLNYNRDKVVELFQGLSQWTIPNTGVTYVVGEPVKFFYPLFKQVNPETGYAEWYVPGDNTAITTKDKTTTEFDETLEQNTGIDRYTPITGGFGIKGDFKGFYLQADFAFALGKHLIVNDQFFFENPLQFNGFNQRTVVTDYWKQAGDVARFPKLGNGQLFTNFDSRLIHNASFMRMKTLTIGYSVPKTLLAKQNFVKGAKLFVTGRNLLTFTKFTGPDPEIESNLTLGSNPNTKQITVGVELNF